MKKLIFGAAVLISTTSFGQRAQQGDFQLNGGVALPSHYSDNVGLFVGFDYGVHKDVTIGAEARFGGKDYDHGYNGRWFGIGINGNYHFNSLIGIPNKWDFYAGPTIGFNTFTWKNKNNNFPEPYKSKVALSAQVGGRYFITNNFALNAEANAGDLFTGGKFGITYKF